MENQASKQNERERRLLKKPHWIDGFEGRIARAIPLHPNLISAAKIFLVFPLLVLTMKQVGALPSKPWIVLALFILFSLLDYFDGTVARYKQLTSRFGAVLDRLTDFPILLTFSYFCLDILPTFLLVAKVLLDLLLIILFLLGKGKTEYRLRTALSYTTLLALLFASQGWAPRLVTPFFVTCLLVVHVAFATVVALYILGFLRKVFIADALSGANLLCGVFSMVFAARGRVDMSLLFLLLGAAFDGFDGAAARKFGGTRWGVYSDDVADAVNYGLAPGVAIYFALGGLDGLVVGGFFSLFTLGRLVFFTLNKSYGDPEYFCGVPSTVGGIAALCAIILWGQHHALVGLLVGVACVQMVSFDVHYRHLGRALASNRRIIYGMPVLIILLLIGHKWGGIKVPVALVLLLALVYGFLPTMVHFAGLLRRKPQA